MTSVVRYLRGRGWLEKRNDTALVQPESKGSLLEMLYARFLGLSTPAISQASSLTISPSRSSLADDTPPLTWKDIRATSHPARWQLETILSDRGSKPWKTVSELDPDLFQAVMDELQRILDYSPQMESGTRTAAIKCLQAIGSLFDGLPTSMMIQDVIQDSNQPVYGGGFADVWFGRVGPQRVALKVLRRFEHDGDEEHMRTAKAFRREAILWRQLQYPRILPFFGVNTVTFSQRPCLVSPYMHNGNVNQFLHKNPAHDRLQMMIEIIDGIDFLHAQDRPLVHADIRGANVLVKEDLTCCISDFGLAMVIDSRITSSILSGGATRWLAPEAFIGTGDLVKDMPSRDIYAFGCTIIEICSGRPPFPNIRRDPAISYEVVHNKMKPPPPPTTFLPQGVWDIIDKCLAYETKHRPTARAVLESLRVVRWKEEAWYDLRMVLKDSEKLLELGTPSRAKSPSTSKYALIIGIDTYEHQGKIIPQLSGCVADAKDIYAFLTKTVHFPPENITCLHNKEATVSKIIAALERLAKDVIIPKGSSIFIFYAGHGTEADGPKGLHNNRKIQMIVPYDFDPGLSTSKLPSRDDTKTIDESRVDVTISRGGVAKNGLPDIKLSHLLKDIADEKGQNITVVFDCCHSGSGTRGSLPAGDDAVARGFDLPDGTSLDIGSYSLPIFRGSSVHDNDRNIGFPSHIFLAACGGGQVAYERNRRGVFTSALTSLLRSANLQQLTCLDIIRSLPQLKGQNPVCEGINQDRIFLHCNIVSPQCVLYNVSESTDGYIIDAGEAHGVTVGDEFTVYATAACTTDSMLGRLKVDKTYAIHSSLVQASQSFRLLPTGAVAVQIHIVRLLIVEPVGFEVLANRVRDVQQEMSRSPPSFEIVTSQQQEPDIIVTAKGDTAHFQITDKTCQDVGMSLVPGVLEINSDAWPSVLRGIAAFFWNLKREGPAEQKFRRMLTIHCYELTQSGVFPDLSPLMTPIGMNLVQHKHDSNFIEVEIDKKERRYGFCIKNETAMPLFVSMFYFDTSDLSVASFYQPPTSSRDGYCAPIPPSDNFTIGYGPAGFPPKIFTLQKGQDIEVGYLKLFLSTHPVDYSNVPQTSPFLKGCVLVDAVTSPVWDTIVIPIVQRRAPSPKHN